MPETAVDQGIEQLLRSTGRYLSTDDIATIRRAYSLAAEAHGPQLRASGAPYVTHPLAVARILCDLRLDTASIVAALLHDVVEDTAVGLPEIERDFGHEVARIVDGVTKLDRVQWVSEGQRPAAARENEWAENVRK